MAGAAAAVLAAAHSAPAQPAAPGVGQPAAPLELLVLGSGGPAALGRAASGYVLLLDGAPRILVDAGPGTFARLGEAHLSLEKLDTLLLTHLHADHAGELPGLVKARAVASPEPIRFDVYGPAGSSPQAVGARFPATSELVELLFGSRGAFAYLKDFAAPVSFKVTDLPASGTAAGLPRTIARRDGFTISAAAGHHGDAPAVIYRIDYRGRSVVFSGDIDAQGLPALERLARDAGLLVFDAVVLDPPASPAILYSLHSPPGAIGALAARSHVGALLLSHLSPAVDDQRQGVLASIATHYRGRVTFATDLQRLRP